MALHALAGPATWSWHRARLKTSLGLDRMLEILGGDRVVGRIGALEALVKGAEGLKNLRQYRFHLLRIENVLGTPGHMHNACGPALAEEVVIDASRSKIVEVRHTRQILKSSMYTEVVSEPFVFARVHEEHDRHLPPGGISWPCHFLGGKQQRRIDRNDALAKVAPSPFPAQ